MAAIAPVAPEPMIRTSATSSSRALIAASQMVEPAQIDRPDLVRADVGAATVPRPVALGIERLPADSRRCRASPGRAAPAPDGRGSRPGSRSRRGRRRCGRAVNSSGCSCSSRSTTATRPSSSSGASGPPQREQAAAELLDGTLAAHLQQADRRGRPARPTTEAAGHARPRPGSARRPSLAARCVREADHASLTAAPPCSAVEQVHPAGGTAEARPARPAPGPSSGSATALTARPSTSTST